MKRIIFTLICLASFAVAGAQDRIVFKNSNELNVKVVNVSPDTVTYKLWSNLNGPTYTENKSGIMFIVYENGSKDVFGNAESQSSKSGNIKFQGYGHVGLLCFPGGECAGPLLDVSVGAAITDYFYAGFETGLNSAIYTISYDYYGREYTYFDGYIPLALNMKGYFTKTKARPFINASLGGFVGIADMAGSNGFYCQIGAGVDIKRISIGLGYNGVVEGDYTASGFYFKVGVRFGGKKYW